jgi:hypothetical protein
MNNAPLAGAEDEHFELEEKESSDDEQEDDDCAIVKD